MSTVVRAALIRHGMADRVERVARPDPQPNAEAMVRPARLPGAKGQERNESSG
jgi:hypothetical protein